MNNHIQKSIFTSDKDFTTLPSVESDPPLPPSGAPVFKRPKLPDKLGSAAELRETPDSEDQRKEFASATDTTKKWRTLACDARVSHQPKSMGGEYPFPGLSQEVKRSLDVVIDAPSSSSELPPRKKQRPFSRTAFDTDTFPSGVVANTTSPVSPLFFSHNGCRRSGHLFPFSEFEAAEIMLKTAREEAGVTTLKLARGNISSPTPSLGSEGHRSADRKSIPRSPDLSSIDSAGLKLLGGIGICELLEQDERPTFLFDLANEENMKPGPLHLLYGNLALRSHDGLYNIVTGHADLNSPRAAVTSNFPEFKAWATSFVKNNEAMEVSLPSLLFAGVKWDCKTLRKRMRLISGITSPRTSISNLASQSSHDVLGIPSFSSSVRSQSITSKISHVEAEPADYFGNVESPSPSSIAPVPANWVRASSAESVLVEERPMVTRSLSKMVSTIGTAPSLASESLVALQSAGFRDPTLTGVYSDNSFDWTRLSFSAALPRHIQFTRAVDWAATSLGPIESWSFDLRAMCNLIMGSPHPAAMYWGPEYIAIYNEAYVLLAGQKHPELMGKSYKTAWAEIWDQISDVFENAWESGQSTMKDDDCLFVKRNGFLEESYFSWSIIPLVGEDGNVVGLYNPCFEKTSRKIAERRMLTLREVGEKTAAAREVKQFWSKMIKGLAYNEYDVPFIFLYSVSDDDSDMSSMNSGSLMLAPQLVLEGTLGVPNGHPAAASPLDLKTSGEGFAPALREAIKTDRPVLLKTEDGSLSADLIAGLEWRGFPEPSRAAVVCPIHPTTGDSIVGFLVMGVNPRRPYDDDYSLFIQLLTRQLATGMASVVLFEEEIRRGQRAARLAALDRIELSKQLELRTQEAVESETRFARMAEFAPVGMFIAGPNGKITYSNDTWWEISRHPKEDNSADNWMDSVKGEDRPHVESVWKTLVEDKVPVTVEFRFKTSWIDQNGIKGALWVLMSAYPEKGPEGNLKSIFGSITNISSQKWAENLQKSRMEEAIEVRRQQENFIDMTSHEMRNPLSAILQCADEIVTTLSEYRFRMSQSTSDPGLERVLLSSVEAASTISLCAQHQKRIVDDVLTLSKLDSALLMVTPVETKPHAVVERALKMFEGELETNDIQMTFEVEQSYRDLNIDWVKLDPSRLLQVLINLTTNAIKFTQTRKERKISLSINASTERPTSSKTDVSYFPTRLQRPDVTRSNTEWGDGERLYLLFRVKDTGRGLDENEKKLLFLRFSQASPRTHVQYGGSGLGLFISRELTELQGGEIGVASERGVGSTFAFYVRCTRTTKPIDAETNIGANSGSEAGSKISKSALHSRQFRKSPPTSASSPIPSSHLHRAPFTPKQIIKVLIVEDNLVNQRVLQRQLRNLSCVTHLANHGVEALALLEKSRFWKGMQGVEGAIEIDVVLMDLEMPVMDGLTCAKRIRGLESEGTILGHVPIIAVTANARIEQIQSAKDAGMDSVVSKPFRINELIPKIEELLDTNSRALV